jgi:glycosyltransferase involved in cell wall biosynthesis
VAGSEAAPNLVSRTLRLDLDGDRAGTHSFARVNRSLGRALAALGCEPAAWAPGDRAGAVGEVLIRHRWPPNFTPPPHRCWVHIQPWEWGALPREWLEPLCTAVDEAWVPSDYVRQIFIVAGVPPSRVTVVPNGVDAGVFRPDLEPLPLDTDRRVRFLFVGGTIFRKGIDLLLEAYLDAFGPHDDVCLVVKEHGAETSYRDQTMCRDLERLAKASDIPPIIYLTHDLDDAELARLYSACDVLVHPYRGEGFGLPILEAMACGLPAIVPRGGACLDFCNDRTSLFVDAPRRELSEEELGMATVGRAWVLEPDVRQLQDHMRAVARRPAALDSLSREARRRALSFTWDGVARAALERLVRLAGSTSERTART